MIDNQVAVISNYETEALQLTLDAWTKHGYKLVNTILAKNKYGEDAMYLFFVEDNISSLEQEPMLDKIKDYINHIRNTGMGKKKSLEFIEKFVDGLKEESE